MVFVSAVAVGCAPSLGECDPVAASEVVYSTDRSGSPAFVGQAIVLANCAAEGVCHARGEEADLASGVPRDLNFDVQLSGTSGTVESDAIARQRHARFRVVQQGAGMLWAIDNGGMPPGGSAGADFYSGAPTYQYTDGTVVGLDRDALRNWLACGAPLVERSSPRDDGVSAVVRPAQARPALSPTWASIYEGLLSFESTCAGGSCHSGNEDAGFAITTPEATYDALSGAVATGSECAGEGAPLLVPGDPDASLFFQKLVGGDSVCGDRMPRGGVPLTQEDVEAVRAWIEAGAER